MNRSNRLAQSIRERKPAVGAVANLRDPGGAEIVALAGYDWLLLDTEHNPLTETDVLGILHALRGFDIQPIVRLRANREEHVKWVLDAGAGGVMIPAIKSADEARHAVSICKYHPLGSRGFSPNRASGYWTHGKEYLASANQDVLLLCMIEHVGAVREIDEICRIEGIDGLWIGPADLAQSLGHLGDTQHADVRSAVDKTIDEATKAGMPWGIPTNDVETFAQYVARGGIVMTLGADTRWLRVGATTFMNDARAAVEKHCAEKGPHCP